MSAEHAANEESESKAPDRVTTAFRLPKELHIRLKEAADDREIAVNYLVVKAVEHYLDRLIPVDELTLIREPDAA